jgi:hypothetical protein
MPRVYCNTKAHEIAISAATQNTHSNTVAAAEAAAAGVILSVVVAATLPHRLQTGACHHRPSFG